MIVQAQLGEAPKSDPRHKVSASQLSTYKRCQRRWGFKYIDKLPDPVGDGARFGTAVHKVYEDYFGKEVAPNLDTREGRLATRGLDSGLYPLEDGAITYVEPAILLDVDGVLFRGYIDLLGPGRIYDHKTNKDPAKYALTADALRTNEQGLIYALWGLAYSKLNVIELRWVYHQTAPRVTPKIFAVDAKMERAETEREFERHVLIPAKELIRNKSEHKTGNDLTPNLEACGDYGGCPFRLHCNQSPEQIIASAFGKGKNEMGSLADMLAKRKAQQGTAVPMPNSKGILPPPRVNSPEAPASVAVQRVVSQVIETTGQGKAAAQTNRTIAASVAGVTDPNTARDIAEKEQAKAQRDKEAKSASSLTQTDALRRCAQDSEGISLITCSKPKALAHIPYVAPRTVGAMEKKGYVEIFTRDDGIKQLTITAAGRKQIPCPTSPSSPSPFLVSSPPTPPPLSPAIPEITPLAVSSPSPSVLSLPPPHSPVVEPTEVQEATFDAPGLPGDVWVRREEFLKGLLRNTDFDNAKRCYEYYLEQTR